MNWVIRIFTTSTELPGQTHLIFETLTGQGFEHPEYLYLYNYRMLTGKGFQDLDAFSLTELPVIGPTDN